MVAGDGREMAASANLLAAAELLDPRLAFAEDENSSDFIPVRSQDFRKFIPSQEDLRDKFATKSAEKENETNQIDRCNCSREERTLTDTNLDEVYASYFMDSHGHLDYPQVDGGSASPADPSSVSSSVDPDPRDQLSSLVTLLVDGCV